MYIVTNEANGNKEAKETKKAVGNKEAKRTKKATDANQPRRPNKNKGDAMPRKPRETNETHICDQDFKIRIQFFKRKNNDPILNCSCFSEPQKHTLDRHMQTSQKQNLHAWLAKTRPQICAPGR